MFKKYQLRSYNIRLIIVLIITTIYGIVVINSADSDYTLKQIVGMAIAFCVLAVFSFIDYSFILKFYWVIYFVNIALLIAVHIFGKSAGGAQRWIPLPGFQLQPSELSKLFLILFSAKLISNYKDKINNLKFLGILALLLAIPLLLVVTQPDLSTTLLIFLIMFTIVYCAGLSYKIIGIALAVVVPLVAGTLIYLSNPANEVPFIKNYWRERIVSFMDPENNDDGAYQQEYSLKAIGSGQLSGKGLNNDDPSSLKNAHYIAEGHTDFIFAIIGEELGFVGCCAVIFLLSWIVIECIIIGVSAKDFAGKLICIGVAAYIGFQTFLNIGVATRILPNTGVPLPFFSYGLTSLITLYTTMGIVLNIGLQRNNVREDDIFAEDFRG